MRKKQSGFGVFGIILLFLLTAVVGYAGWHVYENQKQDDDDSFSEQTSVIAKPKVIMKTETEAANGQISYKNETLGLTFTYPAKWGKEPTVKEIVPKKVYEFDFPDSTSESARKVKAGIIARNYEAPGKDGGCGGGLGISPDSNTTKLRADMVYGDNTSSPGFKETSKLLSSTSDSIVNESFFAGTVEGAGASCPGISLTGFKDFSAGSAYTGIVFEWADYTNTTVPVALFDSYKANPEAFISSVNKQAFINAVESAKSL